MTHALTLAPGGGDVARGAASQCYASGELAAVRCSSSSPAGQRRAAQPVAGQRRSPAHARKPRSRYGSAQQPGERCSNCSPGAGAHHRDDAALQCCRCGRSTTTRARCACAAATRPANTHTLTPVPRCRGSSTSTPLASSVHVAAAAAGSALLHAGSGGSRGGHEGGCGDDCVCSWLARIPACNPWQSEHAMSEVTRR